MCTKFKEGSLVEAMPTGEDKWRTAVVMTATTADFNPIYKVRFQGTRLTAWVNENQIRSVQHDQTRGGI